MLLFCTGEGDKFIIGHVVGISLLHIAGLQCGTELCKSSRWLYRSKHFGEGWVYKNDPPKPLGHQGSILLLLPGLRTCQNHAPSATTFTNKVPAPSPASHLPKCTSKSRSQMSTSNHIQNPNHRGIEEKLFLALQSLKYRKMC